MTLWQGHESQGDSGVGWPSRWEGYSADPLSNLRGSSKILIWLRVHSLCPADSYLIKNHMGGVTQAQSSEVHYEVLPIPVSVRY